jgi:hypothetical protein
MTAQINDKVFHQEIEFTLVSSEGVGLFHPQDHGITPRGFATNCWRGWHVKYLIKDNFLLLQQVKIGFIGKDKENAKMGRGPLLFGFLPEYESYGKYQNLSEPISFTGTMILGTDFIHQLCFANGFPPSWKYAQVKEIRFEEGHMVEDIDKSDEIARIRPQKINRIIDRQKTSSTLFTAFISKHKNGFLGKIADLLTEHAKASDKKYEEKMRINLLNKLDPIKRNARNRPKDNPK